MFPFRGKKSRDARDSSIRKIEYERRSASYAASIRFTLFQIEKADGGATSVFATLHHPRNIVRDWVSATLRGLFAFRATAWRGVQETRALSSPFFLPPFLHPPTFLLPRLTRTWRRSIRSAAAHSRVCATRQTVTVFQFPGGGGGGERERGGGEFIATTKRRCRSFVVMD